MYAHARESAIGSYGGWGFESPLTIMVCDGLCVVVADNAMVVPVQCVSH